MDGFTPRRRSTCAIPESRSGTAYTRWSASRTGFVSLSADFPAGACAVASAAAAPMGSAAARARIPARSLIVPSPFERLAVPLREIRGGLVRRLQKLHQRLVGRRGFADAIVRQDELPQLAAPECAVRPHAGL